jgi:hypothetical protein
MRFRLHRRIALIALLLQAVAVPVQAFPTTSIHWGSCPAFLGSDRYDPTSTSETITVTGNGLSGTIRSVRFTILIWAGGSQVPDAWRFDPGGCEVGSFAIGQTPAGRLCPPLRGTHASESSKVDYLAFPPGGWSDGREIVRYGVIFDPLVADPTTTYTIARLDIDHSNAILGGTREAGSCNCLERPLCISLHDVVYEDGDRVEHTMYLYDEAIHWNDPTNSLLCPGGPDLCEPACSWDQDTTCVASPTSATRASWGRVKAGYR